MDKLIERLRASRIYEKEGKLCKFRRNPDGPAAADTLQSQALRIKKLEEALGKAVGQMESAQAALEYGETKTAIEAQLTRGIKSARSTLSSKEE